MQVINFPGRWGWTIFEGSLRRIGPFFVGVGDSFTGMLLGIEYHSLDLKTELSWAGRRAMFFDMCLRCFGETLDCLAAVIIISPSLAFSDNSASASHQPFKSKVNVLSAQVFERRSLQLADINNFDRCSVTP